MIENTLLDICKASIWNNIEIFKRYIPLPDIIGILNDVRSRLTISSDTDVKECTGCLENQPNQQAHMDYGGCLYDDNV
jgi:hypothetical protein